MNPGSTIWEVTPCSGCDLAVIVPPCASTIRARDRQPGAAAARTWRLTRLARSTAGVLDAYRIGAARDCPFTPNAVAPMPRLTEEPLSGRSRC